ncbi:MAG: hypothetical protein CVU47_04560 [Chloroflexi bacterium HGW-Chloroflexi-9]|nr:MAG: hypothetical protein CVU47_04560 [Chloroflexi bacterium HGW-Chloroflexi-9]
MKKYIPVGLLLMLALGLVGCESEEQGATERAQEARDTVGSQFKTAWQEETGEAVSTPPTILERSEMSESHQIMASMILLGRGMETDLSTYAVVYLVEFKDADGVERAAVYADGKVVLPANAGQ